MNQAILQQPFFQVTLPLKVTFVAAMWLASWSQNKRFDDIHRRLGEIIKRLVRIEAKLDDREQRIVRLGELTSPIGRR
jgi:hypothetical protein